MNGQKTTPGGVAGRKGAYKGYSLKGKYADKGRRKQGYSFAEINALALPMLPALLSRWLPGGVLKGQEYAVRNPTRADDKPGSFSVNTRTGRWSDFATGDRGGDVISLAAYIFNLNQGEALRRVARMLGVRHD
jgi:hypothetical protein